MREDAAPPRPWSTASSAPSVADDRGLALAVLRERKGRQHLGAGALRRPAARRGWPRRADRRVSRREASRGEREQPLALDVPSTGRRCVRRSRPSVIVPVLSEQMHDDAADVLHRDGTAHQRLPLRQPVDADAQEEREHDRELLGQRRDGQRGGAHAARRASRSPGGSAPSPGSTQTTAAAMTRSTDEARDGGL